MTDSELMQLSEKIGRALKARGATVTTAESCTGGWIAKAITDIAGSSAWFERGFVTYSNEAKQEMLGVEPETLLKHGAVSETTASAMAAGALRHSHANWALSITGIAGPAGGSLEKPVGSVCFGWVGPDGRVEVESCFFPGSREEIRSQSVAHALTGLLERASVLSA